MSEFKLKIVCPEGEYYTGQVEILNVVTTVGQMGILANMLPFAGVLEISEMNFVEKGTRRFFFISGGFVHVTKDQVTLITDAIEDKDNIDLERAERAKVRAEKRLANRDAKIDVIRAELALKRALTRIKVKNH